MKNDKNDVIYLDLRANVAVHKGFRSPYVRGVPVGYEEQVAMYPLIFGEFLLNAGLDEKVFEYVQNCVEKKIAVDQAVHQSIRKERTR